MNAKLGTGIPSRKSSGSQTEQILRLQQEDQAAQIARLEAALNESLDQIDSLSTSLERTRTALRAQNRVAEDESRYENLVIRVHDAIRRVALRGSRVIVVNKGDPTLLHLNGRTLWHFPRQADGAYAGYYPGGSLAAIAHLEALRAKGAQYLVFPKPSFWWLDHYSGFKQHLGREYRIVCKDDNVCIIYSLQEAPEAAAEDPAVKLAEVVEEFRLRFDRDPTILDWRGSTNIARKFTQLAVCQSVVSNGSPLPHLDASIDLVILGRTDDFALEEARRVARAAVLTRLGEDGLNVEWQPDVPAATWPVVTIIIPVFNGGAMTETCLGSLLKTLPDYFRGEVVAVDDCSTDDTSERLQRFGMRDERIKILRNAKHLGFARTFNKAAKVAQGEFLVCIRHDTLLLPGWLPPLIHTFKHFPQAGMVGGKVISPEGVLAEAGSRVGRDGSIFSCGCGETNLDLPRFNFVREVDCCSTPVLAMQRALFTAHGGFDDNYETGSYAVADYAFKLWGQGYRCYYQPECTVVHGDCKLRVVHKEREAFQRRWRHLLAAEPLPTTEQGGLAAQQSTSVKLLGPSHENGVLAHSRKVLVVASSFSGGELGSSFRRLTDLMVLLLAERWTVSFLASPHLDDPNCNRALRQQGIEVLDATKVQFEESLITTPCALVLFAGWQVAETHVTTVRRASPTTPVIVDSAALHFVRRARRLFRKPTPDNQPGVLDTSFGSELVRELNVYAAVDGVLTASPEEAEWLNSLTAEPNLAHVVPEVQLAPLSPVPLPERRGVVFGGFVEEALTRKAVEFLCREVVPRLDPKLTAQHPLYILGDKLGDHVRQLGAGLPNLRIVEGLSSILPYLERARVSVFPLQERADRKSGLLHTLNLGTPAVSTTAGNEGLGLTNGKHVLVAGDGKAFARAITKLLTDEALWEKLSRSAREHLRTHHGVEVVKRKLSNLLNRILCIPPKLALTFPVLTESSASDTKPKEVRRQHDDYRSGAAGLAPKRIAIISGEPRTPGHDYRVTMYAKALTSLGYSVRIADPTEIEGMGPLDCLVIWRALWSDCLARSVNAAREHGAKIVFDVDDLMFDPILAKVSIIDGIRSQGFQESVIAEFYRDIQKTMLSADFCTCPTKPLAAALRRFQKTSFVLPNGFDDARYQTSRKAVAARITQSRDGLVRIGYASGSLTHQKDFACMAPAMARLLREHPHCRLVLFHLEQPHAKFPALDVQEFPELAGLEGQLESRPLVGVQDLPFELARFDINLAPLEVGNAFCEAKSELKYFEAALVNVPTVASPTVPFAEAIHHGRTGFLANSVEEWYDALKRLVEDSDLRRSVGKNAFLDVLWRFGPERRIELARSAFAQILGGENCSLARDFALELRRTTAGQRPLPECSDYDVVLEAGSRAEAQVAVVIPLYNYAGYVVDALDSAKAQTLESKELIVVDDCSTDESLSVAETWARQNASSFKRVALLKNRVNAGLARTRNTGFAYTDAPFAFALDADNMLLPKCLAMCLEAIVRSGSAVAYGSIRRFGGADDLVSNGPWTPGRFIGGNYIDAMAMIRRSAWGAVGGYECMRITGWEDYELWCKFVEEGFSGVWVPEVLSMYRVHDRSMLQETNLVGKRKSLASEMHALHPWLDVSSLAGDISAPPQAKPLLDLARSDFTIPAPTPADGGNKNGSPENKAQASTTGSCHPRTHNRQRLEEILPLIRCPVTKQSLRIDSDDMLKSSDGSRRWPLINWCPIFFGSAADTRRFPDSHLSNPVVGRAMEMVEHLPGPVLNISAGGTRTWLPHCIELETGIFRNTDIVGDGHCLPFADAVFDAVLALNAFEHYREPDQVATEILRVLKPGGKVFIHTAFLQPLHEPPWHFFNCTKFGLLQWFRKFELVDIRVSDNFNPIYALAWQADELLKALRAERGNETADYYGAMSAKEFASFWNDPSCQQDVRWAELRHLSQESMEKLAAGFEFIGRKSDSAA